MSGHCPHCRCHCLNCHGRDDRAGARIDAGVWDRASVVYPRWTYEARARQVYWCPTYPACRAKGPRRAECLLTPNHEGDHYGNGYDSYGPLGPKRWPRRSSHITTNPRKA